MSNPKTPNESPKGRGLIVDDEQLVRWSLGEYLTRIGFEIECVDSGEAALKSLGESSFDFMILDVRLPGIDGLAVLQHTMAKLPQLVVIMISAHSSVDMAVDAMKQGAADFLVKPFPFKDLDEAVHRALALRQAQPEFARLTAQSTNAAQSIVGASQAIEEVRELVLRIAATDSATVLIQGESGSGKEVVARSLHKASERAGQAFVQLNCSAVPEQLFESELFGHERGSFTDAHSRKLGLVEQAEGGTIFLDEIGDLAAAGQAKLLHLVENKAYRRVGGDQELCADVRIIAAPHANLEECVAAGTFREDLFFRLNVVPIYVPPLRDRDEDVALLAGHLIDQFNETMQRHMKGISPPAMDMLLSYNWPGNVRELRNVIHRTLILNPDDDILRVEHLPPRVRNYAALPVIESIPQEEATTTTLAKSEEQLIIDSLERARGNQSKAAQSLGIGRDALRYRMKKFGLLE